MACRWGALLKQGANLRVDVVANTVQSVQQLFADVPAVLPGVTIHLKLVGADTLSCP
jgi:hypothetical protein